MCLEWQKLISFGFQSWSDFSGFLPLDYHRNLPPFSSIKSSAKKEKKTNNRPAEGQTHPRKEMRDHIGKSRKFVCYRKVGGKNVSLVKSINGGKIFSLS